jgi:hypothetical protein
VAHHRCDCGVQHDGRRPLVLPELRDQIGRARDRDIQPLPQRVGQSPLVAAVGEREEQADRDRLRVAGDHRVGAR